MKVEVFSKLYHDEAQDEKDNDDEELEEAMGEENDAMVYIEG